MRYLLILTLCLSACSKSQDAAGSEAASKPSEAAHALVEIEGWTGPAAELSDATEEGLSRCTRVHMLLPSTAEAPATVEQLEMLRRLFAALLSQWDGSKSLVDNGCDQAFGDDPVLSQCSFETSLGFMPRKDSSEAEEAFLKEHGSTGKILVTYKYYDPKTAIDDPRFERQCEQLRGEWEAVSVDSPEYKKALKRHPAKAGSTAEAAPQPAKG